MSGIVPAHAEPARRAHASCCASCARRVVPTLREGLRRGGAPRSPPHAALPGRGRYRRMVNTYPFMSSANDLANVPLENAFFGAGAAPVRDGALAYTNLFDSLVAALEKEGFGGVPVAAIETG
ncbi:hypothetical protein PVAP13_2KG380005 [Panicum virgatum]|uniref:Uncharacterized protein n=1 Tax=Panicum virgatum TaxID=38727 RepID=A0A8T0WC97_PANVG|nr:hypothetical protein PVAP13_2KG380005 [Panicum virgatum]